MKTITEFSGILLQRAADAQRSYRAANPQVAMPVAEETPSSQASPETTTTEEEVQAAAASSEEAAGTDGRGESAAATPEPENAAEAEPAEPVDLGTGPEADAVGEAMQVQGDRLSRLMEALDVVGRRVAQVRLVRVLQGETPPQGAQQRGDYYYAVDLAPRPQSQQRETSDGRDGDRRRGPGGRDRGGRPGGNGPRGTGGPPGKGGKFSNDRPSGRNGDLREGRGEMPRAGAGWMLTRAPEDRRIRSDEPGADRRDRRPPRPRFDGPRPPMGARGERPPRGPRLDRAGGRPPFPGPRPEGERPQANARPEGRGPGSGGGPGARRGPGPRRIEGPGPRRDDRNWSGRRRGGWDEPAVPDVVPPVAPATTPDVDPPVVEAQPPTERLPAPADESANPPAQGAIANAATPSPNGNG